jgi:hypothetical protein
MNLIKKLFVYTMVFTMCMAFAPISGITAEGDLVAGDLIKSPASSAVYYYDGTNRLAFPNSSIYFSWYEDFDDVITITAEELAAINYDGLLVTMRSGTMLVKIESDPKVYAVEPGGVLRWVDSEETASALYGDDWASKIVDVSDAFWFWYDKEDAVDNKITASAHPAGTLFSYTDSDDIYYVDADGSKRLVTEDGFTANMFNADYVVTGVADTITYTTGTSVTEMESDLFPITEGDVTTPPVTGGDLNVGLSSSTPASATIPSSATGVVFMKFNLTTGSEAAELNHLTVKREGIGNTTDISKVYIYEGSNRLTSGKTINSTTNEVKFSSMNVVIPANSTKTFSVVGDIALSVSGHHKFTIVSADSVETEGGSVTGSFPISGNEMSLSATDVGTLTASQNNGTAGATMRIGEDDKEIADFDFDNSNVEDVDLTRIVLTNGGNSQSSNLGNIKLYHDGSEIATGSLVDNKITFEFSPVTISKGNSNVNFKVKADIESGINNTIKLYIANSSDVVAVGKTYGYNSAVTISAFNSSTLSYPITISGSEINVNMATDNAETVMADQTDFVFGSMEIDVSADVDVVTLVVTMNETDGGDIGGPIDIDELQLYNRNTQEYIDGTVSGTSDTTDNDPTWTFENFTWNEGMETWDIIGDIPSTASTSDSYYVTVDLDVTSTFVARYQASNNEVANSDLSTTALTGKTKTIGGASLTVTPGSFNNGDAVANDDGVVLAGGIFEANDVSAITITEVAFHGNNDATETGNLVAGDDDYFDKTNVGTISFLVDGEVKDSMGAGSLTNGEVTFDGFNVEIPAGSSATFSVLLDVAGTLDATNKTVRIQMTSVTAKDDNNTSVSATDGIDSATIAATERLDFARVVTLHSSGALTLSMDNTVDGVDATKYILAGTEANKLARVKIKADYEDVKVTKLVVATDTALTYRSVSAINITDADGTVLVSQSMLPGTASSTATFNSSNGLFTVPKGTGYYYVTVDLAEQGDGTMQTAQTGDDFDVYVQGVEAQGAGSGINMTAALNTIDYTGTGSVTDVRTAAANDSTVVGVRISGFIHDTTVPGYDSTLSQGEDIVFAFKVTAEDTDNASSTGDALKAVLETAIIKASYYRTTITTTAITPAKEFRLYRQGKSGYVSSTILATGLENTFDLTNTSNGSGWAVSNYEITPGESAIFYVKAVEIDSALAVDYIQMKLVNLDGAVGDHDIKWDDVTGTHMYDLRLGYQEVTGYSVLGSGS